MLQGVCSGVDREMMRKPEMGVWKRGVIVALLLLQGCAVKKSEEIRVDLWHGWELMEELLQPDFPDAPPLILIHGWNGGEFTWPPPDRLMQLEKELGRDIYYFNYRTGIVANRYPPIEVLEEKLDRFLLPYEQVDIVAHSMGGLLVRQYLAHHPENPIRRVVFLATPHYGSHATQVLTELASIGSTGNIQAAEIQPGSGFLWQLNSLQGAELESVEVLNIYVGEGSWLKTDYVVEPSYAYLPKANNVAVEGMHHTLASRLHGISPAINFIRDGTLPELSDMPRQRNVWLRFRKANGAFLRFNANSIQRLDGKGMVRRAKFTVCCEQRSSLGREDADTAVIEDVQGDEIVRLVPTITLPAKNLVGEGQPVSLVVVPADEVLEKGR